MSNASQIESVEKQYVRNILNVSPIGVKSLVAWNKEVALGFRAQWDRFPVAGKPRSMVLVIAAAGSIMIAQPRNSGRLLNLYKLGDLGDEIGVLPLRFEFGHGRDVASIGENYRVRYKKVPGRNIGSFELESYRPVRIIETLEDVDLKELVSRYQPIKRIFQ
ncbi:hypothetical protein HYU95_04065 [Candidatus Daviesbacteria bacterium]|nr:hypothetical protein [Candidatus Daviesbacteria bacterium]